jgi:hypothetical protein
MSTEHLRRHALHLAERGWHVFPITPGAKKPPVIDRWETRASTDPDHIHHWWRHIPYSIGIATGPSGLVVVDLDTPKHGEPIPDQWALLGINSGTGVLRALARSQGTTVTPTYAVSTPSGGVAPVLHHPTRESAAQHPQCDRVEDRHPRARWVRRRTRQPRSPERV